jgi:hypothetical protein
LGDLLNFVGIVADLVEQLFADREAQRRLNGGPHLYYMPAEVIEHVTFLAYYTKGRVIEFRRLYYLDVHGEGDPDGDAV